MKGNIFSIEALIISVLIISIISFAYTIPNDAPNNSFQVIKLESNAMNIFYFGDSIENDPILSNNKFCKSIFYYTDSNTISEKKICEEIK